MPGKKKNTKSGAGLQIHGNVHVSEGDMVAGDKNINVDRGGFFVGGNVEGSNIVIGNHNQVGNHQSSQGVFFEELLKQIEQRPNTLPEDKEDLKANLAEVQAETGKGEQADETFLSRRLRNIQRIAPDIPEVMLTTLANPASGFATIVRKIAARAQKPSAP